MIGRVGSLLVILAAVLSPTPAHAEKTAIDSERSADAPDTPVAPGDTSRRGEPEPESIPNLALFEDLPDSIRILYGDGRPEARIPVYRDASGPLLDIGDVGRITGEGYSWDPETFRGSLRIDSTEVAFMLDAPFFWVRGEVRQTPSPVRYASEQLCLPFAVIEQVLIPTLGERCRWDAKRGELQIAGPKPWLETLEIERIGGLLEMTLGPFASQDHRLRWDPKGLLSLEIHGIFLPPDFKPPRFQIRGLEQVTVTPTPVGMIVTLRLDRGWVGVRSRTRRDDPRLFVALTRTMREVQKGEYELLTSYLDPGSEPSDRYRRRILLEVSHLGDSSKQGNRYLDNLAEELRSLLEERFHHQVIFVNDRKSAGRQRGPYGLPEMPGVPDGDCWIGLRLESYRSEEARDFLLVVSGQPPRFDELSAQIAESGAPLAAPGGEQVTAPPGAADHRDDRGVRMIPWGQVPRLYQSTSARLARILTEHLKSELQFRPVRQVQRPARIFRGMAMPGVLIYPTVHRDTQGLRALSAEDQVENVARSLAFGIDEFLLELSSQQ